MNYLLIGVGGVVGSLLRYLVSLLVLLILNGENTYIGTLIVNIAGSFALSYLTSRWIFKKKVREIWRLALGTGLLGSFTTFSTLSNELLLLIQQQHYVEAMMYFTLTSLGGLCVSILGYKIGKRQKEGS